MLDSENAETAETSASTQAEQATAETAPSPEASPDETASLTAPESPDGGEAPELPAKKAAAKRTAAKKTAAKKSTAKKTTAKRATKKTAAEAPATEAVEPAAGTEEAPTAAADAASDGVDQAQKPAKKTAKKAAKKTPAKRAAKEAVGTPEAGEPAGEAAGETADDADRAGDVAPAESAETATPDQPAAVETEESAKAAPPPVAVPLFQPPDPTKAVVTRRRRTSKSAETPEGAEAAPEGEEQKKPAKKAAKKTSKKAEEAPEAAEAAEAAEEPGRGPEEGAEGEEQGGERRRRRRGGRRRRRSGGGEDGESTDSGDSTAEQDKAASGAADDGEESGAGTRRRRRRRRAGEGGEGGSDEPENTVTKVRKPRSAEDEITALSGSTRLEAKKQRRREGREAGRRRAPIVSEAEFLARRESVDRVMVIRQRNDLTQIAVLEDKVLVEHYVSRESQNSLIGNVYLGRVQNVLPSMEAAFIDIGKGRNAVLYAGEVNWEALGAKNGTPRKIEAVLKSGQPILVQVTKDPVGHKGARLTSQISLPGRFLVYVPDGTTSGISRKLPDTERNRLKTLLKEIVPETAGVIVRTAAEGASEDELTRDVERLTARWADIESKVAKGNAPQLLYGEPDLTLKVVRDLFTEDFSKLVIAGDDAWDMVEGYVTHVAPDLSERLEKYDGERDVFAAYRIDEQIEKALDRKVWLPSGGSLVIDRTEAMTVVDVNTGKFTGSGGNLEETVTKNNLEAAEEIVRQLRLRDIGGIIVVDFIDMVLESNRDLVLRRMVECLGRDRTRHQVAEVTSLGLVQMTRKRIGTDLLEAFSESCDHCQGRGLILHHEPVEPKKKGEEEPRRGRRGGRGKGREESAGGGVPSPKDLAAMSRNEEAETKSEEPVAKGESLREEPAGPEESARPEKGPEGEGGAGESADSTPSGRSRNRGRGGRGRGKAAQSASEEPTGGSASTPEPASADPAAEEKPASAESAAEEEPAPEEPAAEVESAETKGAEEAAAEAAPSEPSAPAAPKIVTTVRRRGARRAAGPPPGAAASSTTSSTNTTAVATAPSGEPTSASTDEAADEPADAEPLATLLDAAEVDGSGVDGAGDPTGSDPAATPHVPVKRKGTRRR